jgi:hypothetical protein
MMMKKITILTFLLGINFLVAGNELQDLEILIPTYLDNGTCNHARAILNAMERPNAEKENLFKFYSLLTDLCDSGRTEKDMTLSEKEILLEVVDSQTKISILAEGVFANIGNYSIDRFPVSLNPSTSNRMIQNNNQFEVKDENKNLSNLEFIVYPNPNNGNANIRFENANSGKIVVSDISGKITFQSEFIEQVEVKLENLNSGVYLVKFTNEFGFEKSKKLIVKN